MTVNSWCFDDTPTCTDKHLTVVRPHAQGNNELTQGHIQKILTPLLYEFNHDGSETDPKHPSLNKKLMRQSMMRGLMLAMNRSPK